ncbi:hypothetical protein PybrP1_009287, partial [[Pythium] brassicae (nom. inval.)]
SKSFLSTGAAAFGWRDRRRLEGGRLQFSLQKRFAHTAPRAMAQRSWELFASCTQHAALYTASLRARFSVPQVVDAHNFVALREFTTPAGDVVAKTLFLISRLHTERGPAILFRTVDKARLRTRYDGGFADPELWDVEQSVQWLQDVITWVVFSESGDDCVLDFGGDIPGASDYGKEVWMLEVLLIALRWENMVSGPLFAIVDYMISGEEPLSVLIRTRDAYARFLAMELLRRDCDELPPVLWPSAPVDAVWRSHLLLPREYARTCGILLRNSGVFKYSPTPQVDLERYADTLALYEKVFGASPAAKRARRESRRSQFRIHVKLLSGKTLSPSVCMLSTVEDVKRSAEASQRVNVSQQCLIFAGVHLENDKTLRYYNIREGSVVHMSTRFDCSPE